MARYHICTEVGPGCPVSNTTYGYAPNLGGNVFLLVVFAICAIAQFGLAIRYRLPTYGTAVILGCVGEAIGYAGRIILHYNPYSQTGFKIQIVCLILCPSFLAGGLYLTLKHLVLHFGPEKSLIKPQLYTWIFIGFDVFSILTQAAGGGIAAGDNESLLKIGDDVIIAGIAIQIATMVVCVILAIDFAIKIHKKRKTEPMITGGVRRDTPAFRFYLACFAISFILILTRCVYRLPEMSGGWGGPLMREQAEFMVFDGTMVAIAAILMTIAYPGIFFPEIRRVRSKPADEQTSVDEHTSEDVEKSISGDVTPSP